MHGESKHLQRLAGESGSAHEGGDVLEVGEDDVSATRRQRAQHRLQAILRAAGDGPAEVGGRVLREVLRHELRESVRQSGEETGALSREVPKSKVT